MRIIIALSILLLVIVSPVQAYVGPGAGLSLLGALWGLLLAIGAALIFIIAWPLRRMRRRRLAKEAESAEKPEMPHS